MFEITCLIIAKSESGKAIRIDDGTRKVWVPLSAIQWRPAGRADAPALAIVSLPEWLARREGFI